MELDDAPFGLDFGTCSTNEVLRELEQLATEMGKLRIEIENVS